MRILQFENLKNLFISFAPFLFVFIASLYQPSDTDLGWHLKYGEYFIKNYEILRTNIYSTEMAGFAWANTNWLTDVLTYLIFNYGGFLGLTLASALVITFTFWIFSKAYDLDFFQKAFIFPVIVSLESPVNEISFRGQLISIFFLGVLLYIVRKLNYKKKLIFIPLLFLIWANTHGQFILGLGVLGFYLAFKILLPLIPKFPGIKPSEIKESWQENKSLILTFLITVFIPILNPFGIETYKVALTHFNTPELQYILEYLPIEDLSNEWWKQIIFGIMIFFGVLYLFFSDTIKKWLPEIGLVSIFYLLAFLVRRYAWSLYYLGIPLLKPIANFLKPDSEKNATRTGVILFIFYIVASFYLKLPLTQFSQMNWEIYCDSYAKCSPKAIEFIKDNKLTDNLLSLYGWGGFMIWHYPEVKPSIDGRMTVWRDSQGFSALAKYYPYEQNLEDINDSKYDVVLMSLDKPLYERLNQLTIEDKWQKKYEDEKAGVFVRVKSATPSSLFIYEENY